MATVTVPPPSIPLPARFGSSSCTTISETFSSFFDTGSSRISSSVGMGYQRSCNVTTIGNSNSNNAMIAPFHIDELVVGKQVYELCDEYCNVYQVHAIHPRRQVDSNSSTPSSSKSYYYSSSSVEYSKSEQLAREFVSGTTATSTTARADSSNVMSLAIASATTTSKQPSYVVKYIKEQLYTMECEIPPSSFEVAATRLAKEVEILSCLPYHPNVTCVRGVATCGTEAYYLTGRHDGYFALFDTMKDLLPGKILQWKRQRDRHTIFQYIVGCAVGRRRRLHLHRVGLRVRRRRAPTNRRRSSSATAETTTRRRSNIRKSKVGVISGTGTTNRSRKNRALLLERLQVALDISKAIEHLHEHGIVHGEIKTKNIGFDDENKVQLFGFGSAYQHQDDDAESYGRGKKRGFESDVLDFTTLLFELLLLPDAAVDCKHHRIQFLNAMNVLRQHRRSSCSSTCANNRRRRSSSICKQLEGYHGSLFMDVPHEIVTLIEKGWSIDPSNRPSMSEIRKTLYHVLITTQEQR